MTCQKIFERFLELFPNYEKDVDFYKSNKVEKDSIVITLKNRRRLIFTATKNSDSLSILH